MTTQKHTLRQQFLSLRQSLPAEIAGDAQARCSEHLRTHIGTKTKIIAGYSPIRGELDVIPALTELAANGHTACLPVIIQKDAPLIFRAWQPEAPLTQGAYGISTPPASAAQLIPDIILVPLLAFDAAGNRLGYGGGYYDRTIHALRMRKNAVQIIGVGYSIQQTTQLPAEIYDEKLDYALTEKGMTRFL